MKTIETRVLYILAFVAVGYILGMSFPLVDKWPQAAIQVKEALSR